MAEVFRQVGEIAPPVNTKIRSRRNPLDKTTIVSIFPKPIFEKKHTIEPGVFNIPAGTADNPGVLIVGASSWWSSRKQDDSQPALEVPVSSVEVAESVIRDYCNGLLECSFLGDMMPGLFFIPGEHKPMVIAMQYKDDIIKFAAKQKKWFERLVRVGDSLWARSNNNPLVIADEMRLAAKELNLDKPWLLDYKKVDLTNCLACGSLKDPRFPVCPTCKAIDKNHPAAKDLTFATTG